ncbi:RNA polymerase sigma factor [Pelagibacterium xiamenense]|uniref:RNA polymerase sigma factor n=1 Tax=Pelagibacterium xiamenense TaxID=2901140 RepID=UPI001E5EF058|nr:sigma factor [Pelagibacterium xiamenense]MCD7058360.1 transcriptional regulator [Pelagibacterium xiamenense]
MDQSRHYRTLLGTARRYARRVEEAEDIVQEVILAAIRAGRGDIASPANRRWMAGAVRKRAAFDARSAARRQQREAQWQDGQEPEAARNGEQLAALLCDLPRSLRVVAALALSGHSRREIAYLLEISDAALRQRVVALKKVLAGRGVAMPEGLPGLSLDLAYGQIREGLASYLRRGGTFATHDPDGHFFVIRRSQNPQARQQGL